jgi:hypothetical protein
MGTHMRLVCTSSLGEAQMVALDPDGFRHTCLIH